MPVCVMDASAAVGLVMVEEHAGYVLATASQADLLIAPELFGCEVANALWKCVQRRALSNEEAVERLGRAMALCDTLVPLNQLNVEALVAASRYSHPVYDMMYAVLARRQGATVITLDAKFARVLRTMAIDVACPL